MKKLLLLFGLLLAFNLGFSQENEVYGYLKVSEVPAGNLAADSLLAVDNSGIFKYFRITDVKQKVLEDLAIGDITGLQSALDEKLDKGTYTGTAQTLKSDIDANTASITNHVGDTDNPHDVTAAQIGLGSVDNTSDLDKPISTATQSALDGKLSSVVAGSNITIDNTDSQNPIISAIVSDILVVDTGEQLIYKYNGNSDNTQLQIGDVVNTIVEDKYFSGRYDGPDPALFSSYTPFGVVTDLTTLPTQ